ncbi:MarR family transcriptional regulator [Virgibacillus pantothenticus]|uniref:MarR family winged helix-turn-helix transcriptional regulator n=1 Tax=Virgibacillus pantothenticus TaxID=1473 RepID=UPI001C23DD5D|nr:MarR family transcriptional regulator [Virgibacillus pantothenticus]MBU8567127.1 MarR family transcriptional regulator [Virgibacillus pantothenticus]MBU8600841.1 MarR family transcriptional regulator [Virgibacillus pantothenticus]MBU8635279.1 MarR family transcriptional regulator [Virgibacillus pantothenticus]MBU8642979.1 MarR family transcriptional regulator [Virgibacillus pantothenticus]MBU8647001.1 MarR family transcriptional regulator [Virgibacillus pantothenticus]
MDVNQSWGYQLSKIAQEMGESFAKELTNYELTSRDFGILSTIYNNESLTQKDIGLLLKVDRTTMVQLIDVLESKHLVKRVSNPNDRRANFIQITEEGLSILEKNQEKLEIYEKHVVSQMSADQKKVIHDIYHYLKKEEFDNE